MLIGEEGFSRLKNSSVAVFGAGGVGSYIIEALARAGVGAITVVDFDTVAESNLNRQIIATRDTIGMRKVDAAQRRILSINPDCRAEALDLFFSSETAHLIDISKYDYVADAIDTVTSKLLLAKLATEAGVPIIASMGTGNKIDPSKFKIDDIYKTSVCPLAREMRRLLRREGIPALKVLYSSEEPRKTHFQPAGENTRRVTPASISFTPSCAGLLIAGEIIRDLIGENAK